MAERDPATGRFRPPPAGTTDAADPSPGPAAAASSRPVFFIVDDVSPPPSSASDVEIEPLEAPPEPGEDVRIAVLAARGLNALIGRVLGAEYAAARPAVDDVGQRAAPVIERLASRVGQAGVVERAIPVWVVEAGELAGAIADAWGEAFIEAFRRGFRRRRTEREERADGGPDGSSRDAGGELRGAARADERRAPPAPEPGLAEPGGEDVSGRLVALAGERGSSLRSALARGAARRP